VKICDSWLREWVEHGLDAAALAHRLTMLGLEVDAVEPVGAPLERVVVGRVVERRPHPNADKLSLCRVDVGQGEPLGIVCGAANVREGGLYPTALEGARLPNGTVIRATKLRGEPSAGMLCSAAELGLEAASAGLLELDAGAAPGTSVHALLAFDDSILDINITPNRADCFSIAGIARELAAATGAPLRGPSADAVAAAGAGALGVSVADAADCPRFAGRVIRGIRPDARTPLWLRERLRRCGVRPIHPVVDVTNYVMLELGQPMHAYDLGRLEGQITVRRGTGGEALTLLDGREVTPGPGVLVIADARGAVGLAGIMGGARTAVESGTTDIFLESAFFAREAIAGRARQFGLNTDASVRFERGVDPELQARAVERATRLVLGIAGGTPGPVTDIVVAGRLPTRPPVRLRRARLTRLLGAVIPDAEVAAVLGRLGMSVASDADGWRVTPPSSRFDIEREEDLVEEVARVHGYDRLPAIPGRAEVRPAVAPELADAAGAAAETLIARGYQEAITYSFVAPALATAFGARECANLALANPISADLAVMRQSLWPGLVQAARENLHRQQARVRLFETGTRFLPDAAAGHREEAVVAGVAVGPRWPEQWGAAAAAVDYFDVKADLEALLALGGHGDHATFEAAGHPALHPGRSARVSGRDGTVIGWLGELHPALARELDMPAPVVFEVLAAAVLVRERPGYTGISRLPSARRDVAVVVPRSLPAAELIAVVREAAPGTLRDAFVFDIYTGRQVGDAEKSVAIGLILQDTSRTLTDEDADCILLTVRQALSDKLKARIRE
jgi:phenylalanyl-tRNA synthetase beta chain